MFNKSSMHRAWLTVVALAGLASSCASQPEYCKQTGQGSFQEFVTADWRPYCEQLVLRIEGPSNYDFRELTGFFSRHPQSMEKMGSTLVRYPEHEQCFVESQERFEYAALNACRDDGQQSARIMQAWDVASKKWLEDHQWRAGAIGPKLDSVAKEVARLEERLGQHTESRTAAPVEPVEALDAQLAAVRQEIDQLVEVQETFQQVKDAARAWPQLQSHIDQSKVGLAMNELEGQAVDQMQRFLVIEESLRYVAMATYGVGKVCPAPANPKAKELNTVRDLLKAKAPSLSAKVVGLNSGVEKEVRGPITYERIKAYACGPRAQEQQFAKRPPLCSVYELTLQRSKAQNERKWEAWSLSSITEGAREKAVDCSLL